MMYEPIDAVITWVNGFDPAHGKKLSLYLSRMGIERSTASAAAPTRFNACGEIEYCLLSLLKYAPWLRTIYIVTDDQIPKIIENLRGTIHEKKIKLVDHRDIFAGFEKYLPTFNSLSIESMLWRIPGLANHFIYFNDDCMLIRPVKPEDFFFQNKPVLRGSWKVYWQKKWRYRLPKAMQKLLKLTVGDKMCSEHRTVQENSAELTGFTQQFFYLHHVPFPLKKQTFIDFFGKNEEHLLQNIRYGLRDPKQFWPISLACHLEIKNKNVVFARKAQAITLNGACHSLNKIRSVLSKADKKKHISFICLQSLDATPATISKLLLSWLNKRIYDEVL